MRGRFPLRPIQRSLECGPTTSVESGPMVASEGGWGGSVHRTPGIVVVFQLCRDHSCCKGQQNKTTGGESASGAAVQRFAVTGVERMAESQPVLVYCGRIFKMSLAST